MTAKFGDCAASLPQACNPVYLMRPRSQHRKEPLKTAKFREFGALKYPCRTPCFILATTRYAFFLKSML
jgi:hypothetical protein